MEKRKSKPEALRSHVVQGAKQAHQGEFVEDFSVGSLIGDLNNGTQEETVYLMVSPKNARRLLKSIAEVEAGKATERRLLEK